MRSRVLLISLAVILVLSVGLISCGGEGVPEITEYNLTISSTEGGTVTIPGEGTSTYDEGTVVNLTAQPNEGYRFVNWTGDADTITDVEAPQTTISMQHCYFIAAHFEPECTPMVAAGDYHTVGVKSDGTAVAVGYNDDGQCNVGDWTEIAQVAAGGDRTVGVKSDGTVVATGLETELATWNLGEAAP